MISCPNGYYKNNSNNKCTVCDSTCATCFGSLSTNCLSCPGSRYFHTLTNECLTTCPNGYYNNTLNYLCTACESSCYSC